eukprot:2641012-Amphidinium_carterae.1
MKWGCSGRFWLFDDMDKLCFLVLAALALFPESNTKKLSCLQVCFREVSGSNAHITHSPAHHTWKCATTDKSLRNRHNSSSAGTTPQNIASSITKRNLVTSKQVLRKTLKMSGILLVQDDKMGWKIEVKRQRQA